jgi:hypothetical protein
MNGDRRKMSTEHLLENGVIESNGYVISRLRRHIADDSTFWQITRKPSPIDKNVNGTHIESKDRVIER